MSEEDRAADSSGTPDRRSRSERRVLPDRRAAARHSSEIRIATWPEQRTQYLTRFALLALAFIYFNFSPEFRPALMPAWLLNACYGAYVIVTAFTFWHAKQVLASPLRFRATMWLDIIGITLAVVNDPYQTPPSLTAFILIVLGNGMRYGMPLFVEAVIGCVAGALLALAIRHGYLSNTLSPGVLFLLLFFVIILGYAYILVRRNEQTRSQLELRSFTDSLTGLTNRRGLFELADPLFRGVQTGQQRLSVMFADLDKFKAINDTHGHATGDLVLRQLGEILRGFVRSSDIAARYGGDEFVLILADTTIDQAEGIGKRIQEQIVQWAQANQLDFSATIAVAEAPTHGNTLPLILRCADAALYRGKSAKRGRIERVSAADSAAV